MAERDLAGEAGEQHQRERADRREKHLAGEIELEGGRDERKGDQRHDEQRERRAAREPCLHQPKVLRVAGAEIAARRGGA